MARRPLEDFASRLAEKARRRVRPLARDEYWRSVQELFTRDVTQEGLRELFGRETRETFDFFTREIDFADLRQKPWYKRYPQAAWRVFLTMAFRLSPARRILFAVGVPLLWLGWVGAVAVRVTRGEEGLHASHAWALLGGTILFVLLVLELKDKLALKSDLEIARQIQVGLLPEGPYEQEGLSIHTTMRPANTVGGDYFDLIDLEPGRLAIVVGDVAGKGMPAALLMALLQGSLRTLITAGFRRSELLGKLNDHLCANIPANRLITLFYGELDVAGGELRYVNAGHNPPFLLGVEGRSERLGATAMALGVIAKAAFEESSARLRRGDRLVLYTDGVTEAFDGAEAEYGEGRLEAFLRGHGAERPQELIDSLIGDVLAFCGSAHPHDDMTLMVVGRAG